MWRLITVKELISLVVVKCLSQASSHIHSSSDTISGTFRSEDAIYSDMNCHHSSSNLTCPGVNGKEALGIAAGDPVSEFITGLGIWINCIYLDDWHVFRGVLHDGGVVDRFGGLRCIVIDILHFDVDLNKCREWHHTAIHRIDCEPVVRSRLVIQQLLGSNNT